LPAIADEQTSDHDLGREIDCAARIAQRVLANLMRQGNRSSRRGKRLGIRRPAKITEMTLILASTKENPNRH
jgi:hypothetical protein